MPLLRLEGAAALENLQKNVRRSSWPDGRKPQTRLGGVAELSPSSSFTFEPGAKIITIGSCFAREIEKHLDSIGFELPMLKINVPPEERVTQTPNDVLNKYSVHSMENEIRWAFEGLPHPEDKLFLEAGPGLWVDPHLGYNLPPTTFDRVSARRADVMAAMRELATSDVVIITLGLAESWFDLEADLYLNGIPPVEARRRYPNRFALDVLSYGEILASLERIHSLVRKYGAAHTKILITTSPVPFKATFTGDDALMANCYSKSVQRAACEEFVRSHDMTDYFPSYEIVTLTDRSRAYTRDNIHVERDVVGFIMDTVLYSYCPSAGVRPKQPLASPAAAPTNVETDAVLLKKADRLGTKDRLVLAAKFFKLRQYKEACTVFSTVIPSQTTAISAEDLGPIYADYGVCLLRAGRPEKGVEILKVALQHMPDNARLNYKLGIGYARARDKASALPFLQAALRLDPSVAEYHWRLGAAMIDQDQHNEAKKLFESALKIDPNHASAKRDLLAVQAAQP